MHTTSVIFYSPALNKEDKEEEEEEEEEEGEETGSDCACEEGGG